MKGNPGSGLLYLILSRDRWICWHWPWKDDYYAKVGHVSIHLHHLGMYLLFWTTIHLSLVLNNEFSIKIQE